MYMIKIILNTLLVFLALTDPVLAGEQWQGSQLSPVTIETAQTATHQYHLCLDKEIKGIALAGKDSRAVTDLVLKKCEPALAPIRSAFAKENVQPVITNRYLRRKRTQAARNVLHAVMFAQAALPR